MFGTGFYQQRSDLLTLLGHLRTERSSWDSLNRRISEMMFVRGARMLRTERNRGDRKSDYNRIIDPYASRGRRIAVAGLIAGLASPARPWHKLAIDDEDLMMYLPVKQWLEDVATQQRHIFARSNTYRALGQMFDQLVAFGTAPMLVTDSFEDVISCHPQPMGEYYIAQDGKSDVCLFMREYEMTVGQMYAEFGKENCSKTVRNMYDRNLIHAWVPIVQCIQPRDWSNQLGRLGSRAMPWASRYFELDSSEGVFLRESGYRRFPVACARWDLLGGDVYGTGPGADCLGHVERLQHQQLRKSQGIDYQVKPPLQVPTSVKGDVNMLPGGINYVDAASQSQKISSMWDVNIRLDHLQVDIQELRGIIDQSFFVDMFLMVSRDDKTNRTAFEIAARNEEKLLMIGPMMERVNNECLRNLIEATFERQVESGILPPPPPELEDADINIEFISVLAQAQKAIGTQNVDRLVAFVGNIATAQANAGQSPTALHKLNVLETVDRYADMLGTDPRLIVGTDEVEAKIEADQQAMQQAQAMASAEQMASAAKDAAEAVPQENSALEQAMSGFSSL